jgi:3',5'-cyclic AMP phosphodiesterase CpdA
MPLHIAPLSRREFLRRSALAGASLLAFPALRAAASSADPDRWALLSDPHIAGDPATIAREVDLAAHLRAVVAELRALAVAPAGVFVNGDCALDRGLPEDYATFVELLRPVSEAGTALHLTLGNHDERETFWTSLKTARSTPPPLAGKHVSVVEGARANWFLLDSLEVTKQTPGRLGDEQRAWLAAALDARASKPALVMVHHNPVAAVAGKTSGLLDSEELLALLLPRRHVKALFFGHTHVWRLAERDGLHLVNLPAVAYPFKKEEVTGWVDCKLRDGGAALELRAIDPLHPHHGKISELTWRAA